MSLFGEALFAAPRGYLTSSERALRKQKRRGGAIKLPEDMESPEAVTSRITRRNGNHLDVYEDDPLGHHDRIDLRDL